MAPGYDSATSHENSLVYASKTPNIKELLNEFQRCSPVHRGWNRLDNSDDVRFCRWSGQSADGKRHAASDVKAEPWEGASDCKIPLADSIINENVALMVVAFWRSVVRANAVESSDIEESGYITKLFEWLIDTKLYRELVREVELSAQYMESYGLAVINITWARELCIHSTRLTMEQLSAAAIQDPGSLLAMLPELIADPATEHQAVELVRGQAADIINTHFKAVLMGEHNDALDEWEMTPARARKFVRDMRKELSAELPMPYFSKNQPCVRVLRPYFDVFMPTYMTDVQKVSVFHRVWMNEVDLRSMAKIDNWDPDWVEAAVKRRGEQSIWTETHPDTPDSSWAYNWQTADTSEHQLIEVIYAYTRQLDEDDVPCIHYTIFHAMVGKDDMGDDLYAVHRPLSYDHKQMPFVIGQREIVSRNIHSSRGVPEIVASRQREMKVHRDSLIDLTSLAVLPPLNVYDNGMGQRFTFGPAAQNTVTPGREPRMLDIPTRGAPVAFEVAERIEKEINNDFGRLAEDVPPARSQIKQQAMVTRFLLMWTEAMQQVFQLIEQFMPDDQYLRITGSDKSLPRGLEISQQPDFKLTVDVKELDMEEVKAKFEAIAKGVIPLDTENVINKGRLCRAMVRTIDPALAKEISNAPNEGAAEVLKKVDENLMRMFCGNDPFLSQDDEPTAGKQQEYIQEIMGKNKKYQDAMKNDPEFQGRMKQYGDNLSFNIQQQQNKQTGRTGVNQNQKEA